MMTHPLVCPSATSPELLEQLVHTRTQGHVRDLHIDVTGRDVVLTGRTAHYYTRELAGHAVLEAVEDAHLANDIEIC